jgi:F-type H+-transporting ATPase subunit delta
VVAQITSAKPLIDTQIQEIKDELAKVLGKTIRIEAEVDPSLLGGLIVKAGSRMVDGSLKTKLNSLKQAMSEAG